MQFFPESLMYIFIRILGENEFFFILCIDYLMHLN